MGRSRLEPGAAPRQPKGRLNVTTDNQPISAARAAALLSALLPELARAETYPQWSGGTGVPRRGQRVILYDAAGDILGADRDEHREVLRVLMRVEGGDWDRPQTFSVAAESLALTYPVVSAVPLWLSPAAADPHRVALLDVQRHEVDDDPEPPLGGAQPKPLPVPDVARDCARSLADGHMTPVVWLPRGGHDAGCAYVGGVGPCSCADDRPVEVVPVAGEAL
jgi:hypothetical protein